MNKNDNQKDFSSSRIGWLIPIYSTPSRNPYKERDCKILNLAHFFK